MKLGFSAMLTTLLLVGASSAQTVNGVANQNVAVNQIAGQIPSFSATARLSVKDFGAVGDGSVDDTAAVQAALNDAAAKHYTLRFPAGTYLVGRLIYQGQWMRGEGASQSIVKGKPGQDVFYAPDPTIPEANSVVNLPMDTHVADLSVVVDDSVDATGSFSRTTYPAAAAWVSGTVYQSHDWVRSGANFYYQFSNVTCTSGSSAPGHTDGVVSDGGCQWSFVGTQHAIGNAAFAFPYANGGYGVGQNYFSISFDHVRFTSTSGDNANRGQASLFTQRSLYNARFAHVDFARMQYGYIESLPTSNWVSFIYAPDCGQWEQVSFTLIPRPAQFFNGIHVALQNVQLYQSRANYFGIDVLPARTGSRYNAFGWTVSDYYLEPGANAAVRLSLISGAMHTFTNVKLKQSSGDASYITWDAAQSRVQEAYIGNDGTGPVLKLNGSDNVVDGLWSSQTAGTGANFSDIVLDMGSNNRVLVSHLDGQPLETERPLSATVGRPPAFQSTGDYLQAGTAYYRSDADLLIGAREWLWLGSKGSAYSDGTLETGGFERFTAGAYGSVANRKQVLVGDRVPAGKVRVYWKARALSSGSATFQISAGSTALYNGAGQPTTLATNWQTYFADLDLSGLSGQAVTFSLSNPSSGTAVDLAWISFVPYRNVLGTATALGGGSVKMFAQLPACNTGNEGNTGAIGDSSVNTWGTIINGGGANHVLAYCNGTNWTVMAK